MLARHAKVRYEIRIFYAHVVCFLKHRIIEMWNAIPLDIRLSPSCAAFKSGMKKFLSE